MSPLTRYRLFDQIQRLIALNLSVLLTPLENKWLVIKALCARRLSASKFANLLTWPLLWYEDQTRRSRSRSGEYSRTGIAFHKSFYNHKDNNDITRLRLTTLVQIPYMRCIRDSFHRCTTLRVSRSCCLVRELRISVYNRTMRPKPNNGRFTRDEWFGGGKGLANENKDKKMITARCGQYLNSPAAEQRRYVLEILRW